MSLEQVNQPLILYSEYGKTAMFQNNLKRLIKDCQSITVPDITREKSKT